MIKIIQGNNLDSIKSLESESINTCVTSPPYWGLRDYGTATWVGGDEGCDHTINDGTFDPKKGIKVERPIRGVDKNFCIKCGAVREDQQLGLEETPESFVENLVVLFREIRRVLRDDGTVWLNLGDSYAMSSMRGKNSEFKSISQSKSGIVNVKKNIPHGLKAKDLIGIPWRVAFALQQDGWYLRQDIIWHKPNPMPESVRDRCTKSHEYIFLLSKNKKYYYDNEVIKEDAKNNGKEISLGEKSFSKGQAKGKNVQESGNALNDTYTVKPKRNKRSVWTVTTKPFKGAHFAVFPIDLIEPCVLAGCPEGGTVLDPFSGSGTTGLVAKNNNRNAILLELNPEYIEIAKARIVA